MLALAGMFVGFSAFKHIEENTRSNEVTLFFDGDATNADEVKDASNWAEDNLAATCDGNLQACAIKVHEDDVMGSPGTRVLNTSNITLDASETTPGNYIPQKAPSSSSSHEIEDLNRN